MTFWKCYYHLVWSTKNRLPIILPPYEPIIYAEIERIAQQKHVQIHAMNCVQDHMHLAISLPPTIAISDWMSHIKGASSHGINTSFDMREPFRWQKHYGVMTFGEKQLPFVTDYVQCQKEHHANNTTNPYLERDTD
jgi:putative transposase